MRPRRSARTSRRKPPVKSLSPRRSLLRATSRSRRWSPLWRARLPRRPRRPWPGRPSWSRPRLSSSERGSVRRSIRRCFRPRPSWSASKPSSPRRSTRSRRRSPSHRPRPSAPRRSCSRGKATSAWTATRRLRPHARRPRSTPRCSRCASTRAPRAAGRWTPRGCTSTSPASAPAPSRSSGTATPRGEARSRSATSFSGGTSLTAPSPSRGPPPRARGLCALHRRPSAT
mmetsp:Transcript_53497/g.114245  ORF Transcript_53497/g.114245 Transcript_53497/m.114245 type:complete len:229 (+) Transcript_53497:2515-3201(+)